ncbi:uncharacterized protein LOC117169742 [Belonocnema kinseyi]|uniref:uncharacterized protein LOC117169742 n=1 Tax=Belonocnema kinseyi TaxID=2817044 RepID=UPI00143DE9F7|nr:uncharacterized protein LOC117169742 [Belonocnema kinseyi]
MIERWHRYINAAIMCHANQEWSQSLFTVLQGLRSNFMDIGSSPAEFVFGTTLRIPGEFVLPDDFSPYPHSFVEEFRKHMCKIKSISACHKFKRKPFLFKDLTVCSHVFLRNHVRKSLEPPYTGPHKVINRTSDRVYVIDVNSTSCQVSIEHLKPPYFMREDLESILPIQGDSANGTGIAPPLKTYVNKKVTFST